MTGIPPQPDWGQLSSLLNSPQADHLPPAMRARMEADVKAHEQEMVTQGLKQQQPIRAMGPGGQLMAPMTDSGANQMARMLNPAESPIPSAAGNDMPMDRSRIPGVREAQIAMAKEVARQNTDGYVNSMATVAMQAPIFAMQFAHDMTLGIAPSPYGKASDPEVYDRITKGMSVPIKIVSGISSMMLQGNALMKGLSFVGKVPIAARALEFIPQRLGQIGLGALINGGLDFMRADGLQRNEQTGEIETSWLDPSTKIAKPLAEAGIPDRVALGIGGSAVGALIGPIAMGVASGFNAARAGVAARMSDETIQSIREGLGAVGVGPGDLSDKYRVAKVFVQNMRKVALNEEASGVMADQLSREQFIANEVRASGSANVASPSVASQVLDRSGGDLAKSGFYVKPDAAVVLPNAGSIQTGTVDAIKQALAKVGKDEFERQVKTEMMARTADPLAQAAATEEVARRIVAQPASVKSAHQLLQEFQGTAFADTPAHKAALGYANDISNTIAGMETDVPREAIRDRMLRDKLFNADGTPYGEEAATLGAKPRAPAVAPAGYQLTAAGQATNDANRAQAKLQLQGQVENDGKLLAGVFRNNPGGVNLVTNITDDAALLAAQQRLGVKLVAAKIPMASGQVDYMIGRPTYGYPSATDTKVFSTQTAKLTEKLKRAATEAAKSVTAPKTTEAFILHDGTPVRGGLNTSAIVEKGRLQKPVVGGVPRGDLGLQQASKYVRLDISEPGKLLVELPTSISQEQFTALGKSIDVMAFDEVTLRTAQGKEVVMPKPIGALVQDKVAELLPPKSVGVGITPDMISQYKKEGVFAGQAVVLPDGSVGEMIGHGSGDVYKVKEHLTGQEILVDKNSMSILPSALSGELRGSNMFASYLSDSERQALAQFRKSVAAGWARPITKYRDLEQFANSRGYITESMGGGKIRLSKANEGGAEPILVKGLKEALAWVRKDSAPVADLSNDEVTKLLGPDRNIGYLGGGGPPPRMNELMPIDWKRMEATMQGLATDRGPTAGQIVLKPMLPLLRDLDKKFGTQMYAAFSNVQSQSVARANFEALWYHGIGGKLPDGIKPLGEIVEMAGRNANQELITDWREADAIGKTEIAKSMTKQELKSAEELGKWYDAMYPAMGIGAPFVENYMPRYREVVQSGNPQTFQDFMASVSGDPLKVPKGTDWVSDHIRNGFIDTYSKDAFQVATQYLRAGAKNRFMKAAQDEAREMVRMIADKNPNLALPMANALQSMGGYEFAEQRAMLQETFKSIVEKLGPARGADTHASIAEKLTNWATSLVYASTMGFRPSLALRNAKDIWVMSYPIYHGPRFNEAIGYALTREGKEEAMAARVIHNYGGGMLRADEEVQATLAKMPKVLQDIHEASTMLYDSADEFTRAGTYFAAKFKAQQALQDFAQAVEKRGTGDAVVAGLKEKLLRDSKVYLHGKEVENEFLRRASQDPDFAAQYAGKVGADFTNFLYGRGMQARWMRSIGGRFMGQFGSWSMWYADYISQLAKQAMKGDNKADALGILARHAFVNAAILETGRRVLNVDLSRWASYGALAYSGGPGWQIAMGASTLMRGLGDVSTLNEDPMAQQRVNSGAQMIWQTLPSFVPFHSAGRDAMRMATAYDQTELLAASLGTQPTKDYIMRRKVGILTGDPEFAQPFQSTDPVLGTMLNNMALGTGAQPVDIREPMAAAGEGAVQTNLPVNPNPGPQQKSAGQMSGMKIHNRMPNGMPRTMETKPGESKPAGGY
jgi:hypothetical protein